MRTVDEARRSRFMGGVILETAVISEFKPTVRSVSTSTCTFTPPTPPNLEALRRWQYWTPQ
jgi:hypothetical protein